MLELIESVKKHGILVPAIARPKPDGGYELVAGHRRQRASQLAGLDSMPVIVMNLDDNDTIIQLVDSNIQRENILPSEKAFAYKMKLEAIKHQGTLCQLGTKLRSDEIVGESVGESARTVQRFIRLTNLIPELLDMVDAHKIAFNPAVELSYLKSEEQKMLLETMESEQATPSLSQAQRLKRFSQEGRMTPDVMQIIMSEEKKSDVDRVSLSAERLRPYFPKDFTPRQMEETILKLLENWKKHKRSQER